MAGRTGRGSAWTRRSPTPRRTAGTLPARSRTILPWRKWSPRPGRGASPPPTGRWRAWLRERKLPLFAWSSQAQGFFTERAGREKFEEPELVRCWYSPGNFARRDRAIDLAGRRGCKPLHIALAYCLEQDFRVIPLIGPLGLAELEDLLAALQVRLSADELHWLEHG